MKAIVAAGGSGGHIMPALAICRELRKRNVSILYVGNKKSMEETLAQQNNYDFSAIDVQKLYRNFTWKHILFPFKLWKSIQKSKQIIRNYKPDFFLGTGGFVSGPVGYAAKKLNIPIFLQEQNSYPGLTTKLLSKYAYVIFLGYYGAKAFLKKGKYLVTGNPINENIISEKSKIPFEKFGLQETSFKILLLGGSQGSYALNNAFVPIAEEFLDKGIEIIWQAGKKHVDTIQARFKHKKGIYIFDFTTEMGKIYNSADMVISRAGAITLAEIERKKIPAILVPLPSAAENHQYHNAMELQQKNIGIVVTQNLLSPEYFRSCIVSMIENYEQFKANFIENGNVNSAEVIAELIVEYMRGK